MPVTPASDLPASVIIGIVEHWINEEGNKIHCDGPSMVCPHRLPRNSLITCTHVCRRWRNITIGCASLWAEIDLSNWCYEQIEEFIRRSTGAYLNVRLAIRERQVAVEAWYNERQRSTGQGERLCRARLHHAMVLTIGPLTEVSYASRRVSARSKIRKHRRDGSSPERRTVSSSRASPIPSRGGTPCTCTGTTRARSCGSGSVGAEMAGRRAGRLTKACYLGGGHVTGI